MYIAAWYAGGFQAGRQHALLRSPILLACVGLQASWPLSANLLHALLASGGCLFPASSNKGPAKKHGAAATSRGLLAPAFQVEAHGPAAAPGPQHCPGGGARALRRSSSRLAVALPVGGSRRGLGIGASWHRATQWPVVGARRSGPARRSASHSGNIMYIASTRHRGPATCRSGGIIYLYAH